MSEKPKRKASPPALDFVTTLSIEDCVQRLKDAAFSTIDQRLSIRANEQQFVVEDTMHPGKIIRFNGFFGVIDQGTRIWGFADVQIHPGTQAQMYLSVGLVLLFLGLLSGLDSLLSLLAGAWEQFFLFGLGSLLAFVSGQFV